MHSRAHVFQLLVRGIAKAAPHVLPRALRWRHRIVRACLHASHLAPPRRHCRAVGPRPGRSLPLTPTPPYAAIRPLAQTPHRDRGGGTPLPQSRRRDTPPSVPSPGRPIGIGRGGISPALVARPPIQMGRQGEVWAAAGIGGRGGVSFSSWHVIRPRLRARHGPGSINCPDVAFLHPITRFRRVLRTTCVMVGCGSN